MSASVMTETAPATPPAASRRGRPRWFWAAIVVGGLVVLSTVRVFTGANDIDSSGALMAAIGLAVPIGLAGLGGLWSERAGVVNIGLEGMMILGTWGGAFFGYHYGPWAGILGAILTGVVGGAIHAVATVVFGVDHIVSGVAINLLGSRRRRLPRGPHVHRSAGRWPHAVAAAGAAAVPVRPRGLRPAADPRAEALVARVRPRGGAACGDDQPQRPDGHRGAAARGDVVGAVAHGLRPAAALVR